MKRHELTDEQWNWVEPLVPRSTAKTGRPPADRRLMLDGMFWLLTTGVPWRDLPEHFGPWQTVYGHFSKWRREGLFAKVIEALHIQLDERGLIDWDLWCVDGANVRAARAAAGADKKVASGTRTNRPTTLWAAAGEGLDRSSTWLPTAMEFRLPSR
jgi:transposase